MGGNLDLRPYQSGDETAILTLFHQSFGKPMSLEFWNWRFRDNPAAGPMIYLAWDRDILAAHYAVSPVVLNIAGEEHLTALSMTTMTHPDYRGQSLFVTLASNLYMSLTEQGYLMVWGFPNDQSHRGFIRDLNWQEIYEIPMFHLNMKILKSVSSVSPKIIPLDNFDKRFDILWDKVKRDHNIIVKRDSKYLNWRFCLSPQNNYIILGYIEGEELLGYVIFKQYQTEVDVVDILAMRGRKIATALVLAVMDYCRKNEIKGVNMWLPAHDPLHLDLEKIGFSHTHPATYMGARIFKQSNEIFDIANVKNWYFTMNDSDNF